MKRFFFMALSLFVCLIASATLTLGRVHDPDGYTNLRASTSSSAQIVGSLNSGTLVYYEKNGTDWYTIYSYSNRSFLGYMHKSRVKAEKPSSSSSSNRWVGTIYDPDGYTNVRKGPSTKSAIVCRVYSGDNYYFSKGSGQWLKIYSGTTFLGYIHSSRVCHH